MPTPFNREIVKEETKGNPSTSKGEKKSTSSHQSFHIFLKTIITKQNTMTNLYFEEFISPFAPALIIIPPILPIFWKYHVRVDDTVLDIGYSYIFHVTLDRRTDIERAQPIEHINGLTQWGGWGYRFNLKGHKGYIVKNGPGVQVTLKDGNVIVFNCAEPDKVCQILNEPIVPAVTY